MKRSRKGSWSVRWEKRALKEFENLPLSVQERILRKIRRLPDDPFVGKPLHGEWEGFRRLRIGDYRVIYTIEKEIRVIAIVKVGHRRDVYKGLESLFVWISHTLKGTYCLRNLLNDYQKRIKNAVSHVTQRTIDRLNDNTSERSVTLRRSWDTMHLW